RTQFGRAIGSFQAIKHSCVDMLIQVEGGRELVRAAAAAMDVRDRGAKDDGGDAIAIAVNVAVAYMAEAAIDCSQRCLQIHGGIGFTWEHGAHLGLRKARTNAALLSHTSAHWQAVTEGLHRQAAAEAR
ncbi:MAG: acyl-CoA dehydrogenase, partial [Mycobacterium sp.]|nr:acyl-CoA dehydrogenase [Mycobacterium sp.]